MASSFALHLVVTAPVEDAAAWYRDALGARETRRLLLPDGSPMLIDMDLPGIGDEPGLHLALAAEMPDRGMRAPAPGSSPAAFHLPVADGDAAFERAVAHGAVVFEPLHDAFWGERTAQVVDPSGHRWALAQHIRDVDDDEVQAALTRMLTGTN
jgi:PhnB protein